MKYRPRSAFPSRGAGKPGEAGFTLIELLVVMGIMALISGLILANHTSFGGNIQLQNLAYDIALSVRQAQGYGISVERFSTDLFASAYGVHFETANRNTYWLFADVVENDGMYDCPNPSGGPSTCELVQTNAIRPGYQILELCAPADQVRPCAHAALDISFQRPEPDAYIRANGQGALLESARIYVRSPQGVTKAIKIEVNGQIAVE